MTESHHSSIGIHSSGATNGPSGAAARGRMLRRARYAMLAVLVVLGLGAATTVIGRVLHFRDLRAATAEQARNYVSTVTVERGKGGETIALPGTLQGFIESPIYARTSGYVVRWYRDIGAHVSKGDLLADLDTPEVDQQLAQASAAREQAASSMELAKSSAERWENLRTRDAVSQQELDERRSAYLQAQANLAAAEANVRRLRDLEGFKHIVAPYAGVVTRRNVDVGDLVDAGNGGAARALFNMAQTDPLRVYVYVPQSYAAMVQVGETVTVAQGEQPGVAYRGTIRRTAGAIDTATRTLQVEVNLPNREGKLLPGAYVQVVLPVGNSDKLLAPSNSLVFRAEGTQVALVTPDSRVHLQPVTVGRDFGQTIELLTGIQTGDRLILNPADSLAEGDEVTVLPPPPAKDKK
jgi:RND family efflux transporter MFP subunit